MKKNRVKGLLALGLSLTMMISTAGCGKEQQLNAEINPDTPVSGTVSIKGNRGAFFYYKCTGYFHTGSQ